jgi:hypothetical protein
MWYASGTMTTTTFDSHAASREYFNRPADEEFCDLDNLISETKRRRDRSEVKELDLCGATIREAGETSPIRFAGYPLTPWAFSQLCARLSAPADFVRQLNPDTIQRVLRERQARRAGEEKEAPMVRALITEPPFGGQPEIRAILTPRYERVWDTDLFSRVKRTVGDILKPAGTIAGRGSADGGAGQGGQWSAGVRERSGIYSSDRNTFAFMVNPTPLPGPDGGDQLLYRGTIIGNSETGERKCFAWFFAFDSICANHIIWGASEKIQTVAFRHIGKKSVDRGVLEIERILETWAAVQPEEELDKILMASKTPFYDRNKPDERERKLRAKGFPVHLIDASDTHAEHREEIHGTDRSSYWGVVCGITRAAQELPHAGERLDIESWAGEMLQECQ